MGVWFNDELVRAFDFLKFNDLPIWINLLILVAAAFSVLVPAHEKVGAELEASSPPLDS
jgi:hypothetical protein